MQPSNRFESTAKIVLVLLAMASFVSAYGGYWSRGVAVANALRSAEPDDVDWCEAALGPLRERFDGVRVVDYINDQDHLGPFYCTQ